MKLSFLYGMKVSQLIRALRTYGFHPGKIGVVLTHLIFAVFNSILSLFERKIRTEVRVKSPIFIMGHYRCGTTHLFNLMTADGHYHCPTTYQVIFPNHFLRTEKRLATFFDRFSKETRPQDSMKLTMNSPQEEEMAMAAIGAPTPYLAVHFPDHRSQFARYISMEEASEYDQQVWKKAHLSLVRKFVQNHGEDSILILKSPANTARVKLLLELYPDARFIHIVRDPYRTIQSTMHLYSTWYTMASFHDVTEMKLERDKTVLDTYEKIYRCWLEQRSNIPAGQLIEINFKELVADPVGVIAQIFDQLGDFPLNETALNDYLHEISSYSQNDYEELSPEMISAINRRMDFVFKEYGYPRI